MRQVRTDMNTLKSYEIADDGQETEMTEEAYQEYLLQVNGTTEDVVDWTLPAWSSDLSQIPFDVEVTVAWNFTNSTHTKSIVTRVRLDPDVLWLDGLEHCINLSDARYWIGYPELPKD